MDYRAEIQRAIDYMEENLAFDVTPEAAAQAAGYSLWHFCRIFRETVGMSPADYIRRRRLSEIVRCAMRDDRPLSEIAFAWGFNSRENFTRAFKREHHILPTEFRGVRSSLRLYARVTLVPTSFAPSIDVVTVSPMRVVAYPGEGVFPPHFWNRYHADGLSRRLSGGGDAEDIGICCRNGAERRLDYWIGIREADAAGDRRDTVTLTLPGGLCAVVTTPPASEDSFVEVVHRTWEWFAEVWLPSSGYCRAGGYEWEIYTESSRTFTEKIYIPLLRKDDQP